MCVDGIFVVTSSENREAACLIQQIVQLSDPIYGNGFRQARQALKRLPLKVLVQYLKEKRCFPGCNRCVFFYH